MARPGAASQLRVWGRPVQGGVNDFERILCRAFAAAERGGAAKARPRRTTRTRRAEELQV
jgi:hypothetical protein